MGEQWSKGRRFLNGYGPTETSICATMNIYNRNASYLSIGRPLQNVDVYVLDRQLQPVPPGVPAELYIGARGLAKGYLNAPELTSHSFIRIILM